MGARRIRNAKVSRLSDALRDNVQAGCYHLKNACKQLGISYNTLQWRILEGKIRPVDGRITGAELRRYLTQDSR